MVNLPGSKGPLNQARLSTLLQSWLGLPEGHARLLGAAGVTVTVANARGYRLITKKADLESLGYRAVQARVPALLIPLYTPGDGTIGHTLRTDTERMDRDGSPIKYESRLRQEPLLDANPVVDAGLTNAQVPLWITDGPKRSDSLASAGACAVSLLGLRHWQASTIAAGTAALPSWRAIALHGRAVYITLDSAIGDHTELHRPLALLKLFLEDAGASVHLVYLSSPTPTVTVGVDDFLGAGGTLAQLMGMAVATLRHVPSPAPDDAPYYVTSNGTFHRRSTGKSDEVTLLANFSAEIISNIEVDDGLRTTRRLEIRARLNTQEFTFEISADQFSTLNWVMAHLGPEAFVYPGQGTREHFRTAVQRLSTHIEHRRTYGHIGWRRFDTGWAFLHAGGAIGVQGALPDVDVHLDGALLRYALPDPPDDTALVAAVEASLMFLKLGPGRITYPLLAATYAAPLNVVDDMNFAIHAHGSTGTGKSASTAITQSHYGLFDGEHFPENWSSTANALERNAFIAKDALFTIDEYSPQGGRNEIAALNAKVDRVLRAQANRQGRARLRADASPQEAYVPRGLIVSSGEDMPPGASLRARVFGLEFDAAGPEQINWQVLSQLQIDSGAGLHRQAMSSYLRWLAPQIDQLQVSLPTRHQQIRALATSSGTHKRTPDIVAGLALGLEMLLAFALEVGAIDSARHDQLWAEGWAALGEAAAAQGTIQAEADPATRFVEAISSALATGQAHLANLSGTAPTNASAWGWHTQASPAPQGVLIGWVDQNEVYLDPQTSLGLVGRVAGSDFPFSARQVWKALDERGLMIRREHPRFTYRKSIQNRRQDLLHLRASAFGIAPPAPPPPPGSPAATPPASP